MALRVLPGDFSVLRLEADAAVPQVPGGAFYSVTRTPHELSVVCETGLAPDAGASEPGWRALEVQGPLAFDQVGILAALSATLAGCGVSIFAISTYDTDYILLKETRLADAVRALRDEGHEVAQ